MCVKALGWPVVTGVLQVWLLVLPYSGKCRNFAWLREGFVPVPPVVADALVPATAGSLASVLASALVPARRPKGRNGYQKTDCYSWPDRHVLMLTHIE